MIKCVVFILIMHIMLPLFSEQRVIEQTVARIGSSIITELEIRRFYSLFIEPGKPPYYGEAVRQHVLNEQVDYLALKEYLNVYQFHFDERRMQKLGEEIYNQFKNSFPSRIDYLVLLKLIHLDERQARERFLEYFVTIHKMEIILESRLREENKVEVELKQGKRVLFDLLIVPRSIQEELLFSTLLNYSSLQEVYISFINEGIEAILQRHSISEEEQVQPKLQEALGSLPPGGISLPLEGQDHYQVVQLLDVTWQTYERQEKIQPGEYEQLQEELIQKAKELFPVEFYD